ncbi:MAG: lamin tail domain-containing protein [Candidatus Promineifilaceae bacterium]|nr:lamin tail domain-containing protein [Candidatus Promineifilaceae bacterium]
MPSRRILWLLLAVVAPFLSLWLLAALPARADVVLPGSSVIISEVAWAGTDASSADEWIELHNPTANAIALAGWTLVDGDGDIHVPLAGTIPAHSFFLLERTDDTTVADIPADLFFTGALDNAGDSLRLLDPDGRVQDSANGDGGAWPAGAGSPDYRTLERRDPLLLDRDGNWTANDGAVRNGLDAHGQPLNGTPRQPNSAWVDTAPVESPDLVLRKFAPPTVTTGAPLLYKLVLSNTGSLTATDVTLTDTLPGGTTFAGQQSELQWRVVTPDIVVWSANTLSVGAALTVWLTVTVDAPLGTQLFNHAVAAAGETESAEGNNSASTTTIVESEDGLRVLLGAVLYDGYELGDADEAVQLYNPGAQPVSLGGWRLGDGESELLLPQETLLAPGESLWIARQADAFYRQFGFYPAYELAESVETVPQAAGSWPVLGNSGDEVMLWGADGTLLDALVYEGGDPATVPQDRWGRDGWSGAALEPYTVSRLFPEEGQILYRRRAQASGRPVADTNTASDWAQARDNIIDGRKVQYPGWSVDDFFFTARVTETATLTVAVAPDHAFSIVVDEINRARHTLQMTSFTFEHLGIAEAVVAAAERGVTVTVLLEGAPVGGLADQEKYICQQIEAAGGACWFMYRDDELSIQDRYRYLHAKYMLVDGQRALISSENFSPNSMPDDEKSDGTWGRRGTVVVTNARGIIERLQALFRDDFDPESHQDLIRWGVEEPAFGPPPADFVPITATGGISYTNLFTEPGVFSGAFSFELLHAPENALRDADGLLGLLRRARQGDTVLVQQLSERLHWGPSSGSAESDPNPRLAALIAAARRGARVRLLLDGYYDDPASPLSNRATCDYINRVGREQGYRLACQVGNPTGMGIHNKMVLLQLDGRGWIHVGSLNGTEQAAKGNREVALQVQSDGAFAMLARLFERDWSYRVQLPVVLKRERGRAHHVLISEVLYDPAGRDDKEFIELVNPTNDVIDLSGWGVGDAVSPADYEDLRLFPAGTLLEAQSVLVVATTAVAFRAEFGADPDFEILESDARVPNLIDHPHWGEVTTFLQLGNEGDEVILRDPAGRAVDVVAYGTGLYPNTPSCPAVIASGYSLERVPYWRDTNGCEEFRGWPFPSPGELPLAAGSMQ